MWAPAGATARDEQGAQRQAGEASGDHHERGAPVGETEMSPLVSVPFGKLVSRPWRQ